MCLVIEIHVDDLSELAIPVFPDTGLWKKLPDEAQVLPGFFQGSEAGIEITVEISHLQDVK